MGSDIVDSVRRVSAAINATATMWCMFLVFFAILSFAAVCLLDSVADELKAIRQEMQAPAPPGNPEQGPTSPVAGETAPE